MAARGVVVDRFGRPVPDDDNGGVLRDGERLRVPVQFMDAKQRAVAAWARGQGNDDPYEIDDELAEKIFDARESYRQRISAGMHRHRIAPPDGEHQRRSDSTPPSPPPQPQPHGDLIADAELRRAQAYAQFRQRLNTAGPNRRSSSPSPPSPPASDADTSRRAYIARLRHAFRPR